jgi:hypothetical protein
MLFAVSELMISWSKRLPFETLQRITSFDVSIVVV